MRIVRDADLEREFLDSIKERLSEPREGIHRSDLFPCVRRGKAARVLDLSLPDEEALWFTSGRTVHAFILGPRFRPVEQPIDKHGVLDTPDGWTDSLPNEVKTTRVSPSSFPDVADQPLNIYRGALADYLDQLRDHCLWAGTPSGVLTILFHLGELRRFHCPQCPKIRRLDKRTGRLRSAGQPLDKKHRCPRCGWQAERISFRVYRVNFTDSDFEGRWAEVLRRKAMWESSDDPMAMEPTPNWRCATCIPGKASGCEHYGVEYR